MPKKTARRNPRPKEPSADGLTARQRQLLERVIAAMLEAGPAGASAAEITRSLGIPRPATEEVVRLGLRSGHLIGLGDAVVLPQSQFEQIRRLWAESGKFELSVAEFRDLIRSSRMVADAVLSEFELRGWTERTDEGKRRLVLI